MVRSLDGLQAPKKGPSVFGGAGAAWSPARWGSFAIGVDRSDRPFRGFLPRKTTPRDPYQATVIAKLPETAMPPILLFIIYNRFALV